MIRPYKPAAAAKLREAQGKMEWARGQLASMRLLPVDERARWLGAMSIVERVAVACAALDLSPNDLPECFAQRVNDGFDRHPYAWQVVLFAKFGLGNKTFTSKKVLNGHRSP